MPPFFDDPFTAQNIRCRNQVVCSPKSGPLFELVPASDMELNYGQETEA